MHTSCLVYLYDKVKDEVNALFIYHIVIVCILVPRPKMCCNYNQDICTRRPHNLSYEIYLFQVCMYLPPSNIPSISLAVQDSERVGYRSQLGLSRAV